MLKKQSFRKVNNIVLLRISYWIGILLKKPVLWGNPSGLSIEPTTACNLNCLQCPTGLKTVSRKQGNIDPELFKKIINENYKWLSYLMVYFQGEPLLNKHIFNLISYANKKKVYTATSTNGHFLTEENCIRLIDSGLDKLIISIDGNDQETYEKYRKGGELKKVIEGTKKLIELKSKKTSKSPEVEIQFLVTRFNQSQVEEMKKLSENIDADRFKIKTAQIYNFENGNELIPTMDQYSRYKKDKNGNFSIKNKLRNHCWRMWSSAVITWDGLVLPCCFDKDAEYQLGSVTDHSLKSIWKSNRYQSFRNNILKSRKEIEMCRNCTEGLYI